MNSLAKAGLFLFVVFAATNFCWAETPERLVLRRELSQASKLYEADQFNASITAYQRVLVHCEYQRAYDLCLLISLNMAGAHAELLQNDQSLALTRKAWQYYQLMDRKTAAARFMVLSCFGGYYATAWQLDSAQTCFKESASLLASHPELPSIVPIYVRDYYSNYAYFNYQLMAYAEAIRLSQQALQKFPLGPRYTTRIASVHNTLGRCYRETGQYKLAEASFQKAIQIYETSPLYQSIVYCNLAEGQLRANHVSAAEYSVRQAQNLYNLARQNKENGQDLDIELRLLENTAELRWQQKQLPAASNASNQLIVLSKQVYPSLSPQRVDAYCRMSNIYERQHRWLEARQMANLAVKEAYGAAKKNSQSLSGRTIDAALPYSYLKALVIEAKLLRTMPTPDAATQTANYAAALANYETAIDITSSLRRTVSLDDSKAYLSTFTADLLEPAFALCYELTQRKGKSEVYSQRAFRLLELSRNALLTDAQTEHQLARYYLPKDSYNQLNDLKRQLSQLVLLRENDRNPYSQKQLSSRIQIAETKVVNVQAQIDREYPAYAKAKRELSFRPVSAMQRQLPIGEVVISHVVLPKGVLVLACSRSDLKMKFVPVERAALVDIVSKFKAEVSRDPGIVGTYQPEFARQLYGYLLRPLENDLLKTARGVTLLPPPELMIPFEALETKPDEFMIERYDVGYSYNLFALTANNLPGEDGHTRPLVVAPFADSTSFATMRSAKTVLQSLPASRREIEVFGGAVLRNQQATKKRFLQEAPQTDLIVCVTHTVPDAHGTALAFWPGERDHLLFPAEIQHTDLRRSQLVVLSACETERGVALSGDGVQTLGRAFTWAGAKAVTCSLFPLNDSVQARLGNSFYRKLSDKQTIRETLREAKLDFLRSDEGHQSGRHPFFWAGVVVFGGNQPFMGTPPANYWPMAGLLALLTTFIAFLLIKQRFRPTTIVHSVAVDLNSRFENVA